MAAKNSPSANRWDAVLKAATSTWSATLRMCVMILCIGLTTTVGLTIVGKVIAVLVVQP